MSTKSRGKARAKKKAREREAKARQQEQPQLDTQATTSRPPTEIPNPTKRSMLRRGQKSFVFLLAVGSFVLAFPPFLPWISVSTETSLDPTDPFATPFIIHNLSYLPIYKVRILCHFNEVTTDRWYILQGIRAVRTAMIDKIRPDGRVTSECWFPLSFRGAKARLISGDIEIVVSFLPAYHPWRQERSTRFIMQKDASGQEHWLPAPPKSAGGSN